MHTNDMIYRMNLGLKSIFCYQGARELGAATLATTGNLSMRYFGFYERGLLGVICHRVSEIGKILTDIFAVGVTKEFGRNYCTIQIKKKQPELFRSRLEKLLQNSKKNRMYGEWNDNGRLLRENLASENRK